MESLKKHLNADIYIFKCSQCQKNLDISDQNFFCKNCKSNYCPLCIKAHNEVFIDHEVVKANEELSNNDSLKNSLLANPDLDLDDRGLSDKNLHHINNQENEELYSDITMLFHETLVSLEENFNEEICKLKAKKNKQEKEKEKEEDINDEENKNKINIEKTNEFNIEELRKLETVERIRKILEIINKK
jgi:hypothetical protein